MNRELLPQCRTCDTPIDSARSECRVCGREYCTYLFREPRQRAKTGPVLLGVLGTAVCIVLGLSAGISGDGIKGAVAFMAAGAVATLTIQYMGEDR